jgi:hypothetical protein
MRDQFTKRNHYNPCAWIALWNATYFQAIVYGAKPTESAREQIVFVLNLRSCEIYESTVERVHWDKGLGVAEITPDAMKAFCRRWHPDRYNDISEFINANPESIFMDFEDILQAVEQMPAYESLIEAARLGGISSPEHRGFLTCLLIIHAMRSHEMMQAMLEVTNSLGIAKWEYFWLLKNAWSNQALLMKATMPLACSRWTLYRTNSDRFPLCDSPVMIGPHTLMAILSPCLLLEVDLNVSGREDEWYVKDNISSSKFREFKRRAIKNSFKEIIFSERKELELWRGEPEFSSRARMMSNLRERQVAISDAAACVVWAMLGFGRLPRKP